MEANFLNSSTQLSTWLGKDCNWLLDSVLVKAIKTIAYLVLIILVLFGNSFVIAVIRRNRRLRTIINFFILNMALSDLLLPLFGIPIQIKNIYMSEGQWLVDGLVGSITCKLQPFAEAVSIIVSILTLLIVAVERFFCIVFPMRRQPIKSKKSCFILIALTWIIAALCSSSYIYRYNITHHRRTPYCRPQSLEPVSNKEVTASLIEYIILHGSITILPFILLTGLYSAIIVSLHRQKANLHLASEEIQRRAKKYRRITYMLVTVVVVFLVTWAPLNIYLFTGGTSSSCDSRHWLFVAHFSCYIYPAVNPLIYYMFNESYRKGFQGLFRCWSVRQN